MPSSLGSMTPSIPADAAQILEQADLTQLSGLCLDQARVAHYWIEFVSRHPGRIEQWAAEGKSKLKYLVVTFAGSRFLAEELLQHPDWLDEMPALETTLSVDSYHDRLQHFLISNQCSSLRALDLATFRRHEILRVFLRDALSFATLAEITAELSHLADAILQVSLSGILRDLTQRFGHPSDASGSDVNSTFCVIALGKLGGEELNYSSDIDLMFLYGQNGETSGPEVIANREFYKKVANRYTELLSTYTPEGLCYRVDLRLRPEGKLGEICVSLEGARQYYERRARDWELQMLIKGRIAAGNHVVGQRLLDHVEPLIYSTTTDFSAIETMSVTRERLAEKLASKRLPNAELDVKVTRGGIRDIEFLVQCLQRLHGGRDRTVRHGGTIRALSQLFERDLISATEYSRLISAYEFLRHLEHRLQLEDDRQTHRLPALAEELNRVAMRMPPRFGLCQEPQPGVALMRQLTQHLEKVQVIYTRIVHAQRPLSYGPLEIPSRPDSNEEPSTAATESGAAHRTLDAGMARQIDEQWPALAQLLKRSTISNATMIERFWEALVGSETKLSGVRELPLVADYALQILNLSPYLSEQLIRDIALINGIRDVATNPNRRAAFEGLASPLNDIDRLRRFFRREMFRIQTASICAAEPVFQTLDRTSALAEFMIARAYRIALERSVAYAQNQSRDEDLFVAPEREMMVVALGRLGMREFDIGSDADLLFIIPDSEVQRQKFWTRVAEHIIEILTAYTGEGDVLSIDTRLRPNGREGLLVQTESTYTDYFANHSEAWEGISYMKARAVAGDMERATAFLTALQQVDWRRWGQSGRSRQDLKQMRLRLEREQGNANPLKAGRGGYYDADFALMYLRLKGAGLFFKSLNTPERIDIVEKMGHLERSDAEFLLHVTTFYRAVGHALRVTRGQPEGKLPKSEAELNVLAELVNRWTGTRLDGNSLAHELKETQESMRELFDRLFG
jgi:[glutamine synthetase] adenylyltransferase / [glutamine synthetase]-adenylyl-L-tyrosine phosphorylase